MCCTLLGYDLRRLGFLQVEPQANEEHFSQSVFLSDLTGIMIGDEAQQRSFSSTPSFTVLPWMMEWLAGGGGGGGVLQGMRERFGP